MNIAKLLVAAFLVSLSTSLMALEKKLPVPFYYQDDACWCGVATAEMWTEYGKKLKGEEWKWYKERQKNLANLNPVGTYSSSNPESSPCGPKGGVTLGELTNAINKRLGSGYLKEGNSPVNSAISNDFHKYVKDAIINKNQPIAVMGNTRYKDKQKKYGTHWYLITGIKDNGSDTVKPDEDGYYIYDAAYNSPHTKGLKTITKGKFVSHRNFLNLLAYITNNRVYFVRKP